MRRTSALFVAFALGSTAPLAAQSDSAARAPTFHAGQWAAQFGLSNGFYGIGALRHTSPSAAWSLSGSSRATHDTRGSTRYGGDGISTGLTLGRRWYRQGTGRVRPFRELGLSGSYTWGKNESGGATERRQSYAGGVYGQLGAMIFFAPELGVGAQWNVNASYNHDHYEVTGVPLPYSSAQGYASLEAGRVSLVGAFYF